MAYTVTNFIEKANQIHNFKYDYSKVNYVSGKIPVVIICPIHGDFEQKPCNHLAGRGCQKCASESRARANKLLQQQGKGPWALDSRKKAAETMEIKFGAKTWAESSIGRIRAKERCADKSVRKRMSESAKSDIARQHYAETSMKNHGAEHWTKSTEGRAKLHSIFSTDEERLARSQRMLSDEVRQKIEATSLSRYGTKYYWQSDEARKRLHELLSNESVQQKIIQTKKERGTLNSSKAEKTAYFMLCDKFGVDDIDVQYKSDRYPFACDFYIKSLDLFIEINASWLHGFHWFDANNTDDLNRLAMLDAKSKLGKPMYSRAIYIWTYDDLRKRQIAEENNLNYFVFWKNDLSDFKEWLNSI